MGILTFLALVLFLPSTVEASHNQNLYVSAENLRFNNHFAGSMVIEVVVMDTNIRTLDDALGEPSVTLNGKKLRMAQASDGNWYAYFANADKAQEADEIADNSGTGDDGQGLDFGVFCGENTAASVFGVSFSDTEGIAISTDSGVSGTTDGTSSFSACTGTPASPTSTINNVVRNSPSLNQNSNVPVGQIGIDADIWPVVQLFSFSNDVTIQYNRAGGTQSVTLHYDDIENISINVDRTAYPTSSDVIATIYDMQLNQDPTSEDTWTFTAGSTQRTFYYAFTSSGSNAANSGTGLRDIASNLSNLGFDKNGKLSLNLGNIAELKTNQIQPSSTVSDGTTTFSNIVTFAETEPNSGIFVNSDHQGKSNVKILSSAPRGQSAILEYNSQSTSIVSGTFTASVDLGEKASKSMQLSTLIPGKKFAVTLVDPDQNLSSMRKDDFRVYNSTAIIPSIQIGDPITLEKTSAVKLFSDSGADLTTSGISSTSFRVNDTNSDILLIDTRSVSPTTNFEKISINLGITADTLQDLLVDDDESDTDGTNWINYDFRSFQNQLELDTNDFSDTTMTLYFGSLSDSTPVTILDSGDISNAKGLIQIDNADVVSIKSKTGAVFLVVNFDSSSNTSGAGRIASETDRQPIVFDLFSFGEISSEPINNAKYRLELKESEANSGSFTGSMEISQSSQTDSSFVRSTLQTISDDVKLLINQRLLDEKGIDLKYSDIASAGIGFDVSSKTDVRTNDGQVTLNQRTFRFGQPVKVILIDPDLNQKHDKIDIYLTSNDSSSSNVDTVIDQSGNLLLEIMIKDVRYKRCTISGVETGGLASTGFTLVETGPATGIFEGIFRMPTQICNSDGTRLISPAGGSIEVEYHDALDSSGESNIFGLTFPKTTTATPRVDEKVPDWIKTNVRAWADKKTSDDTFLNGLQYLINENLITPKTQEGKSEKKLPSWIKNNAKWWSSGLITQDDYLSGLEYLIEKGIIRLP
ncbi:MAG: peptidase [Thaumarchaeota archaeon]|nr:peptidase [Nitrososphaerota archaeon]